MQMERDTLKKAAEAAQAALEQLQTEVEAERCGHRAAFGRLQAAADAEEGARRAAEEKLAEAKAAAKQLRTTSAGELKRLQQEKREADARISALQTRLEGVQVNAAMPSQMSSCRSVTFHCAAAAAVVQKTCASNLLGYDTMKGRLCPKYSSLVARPHQP